MLDFKLYKGLALRSQNYKENTKCTIEKLLQAYRPKFQLHNRDYFLAFKTQKLQENYRAQISNTIFILEWTHNVPAPLSTDSKLPIPSSN